MSASQEQLEGLIEQFTQGVDSIDAGNARPNAGFQWEVSRYATSQQGPKEWTIHIKRSERP